MSDKWILDVIADLQSFAQTNDMLVLAHHLDTTTAIAEAELAAKSMQTNSTTRSRHVDALQILTRRATGTN